VNELLANGKGVFREEESEGSRSQNLGSTNRNHIRLMQLDKTAEQVKIQTLPKGESVNMASR
jgi:hypothetical protein